MGTYERTSKFAKGSHRFDAVDLNRRIGSDDVGVTVIVLRLINAREMVINVDVEMALIVRKRGECGQPPTLNSCIYSHYRASRGCCIWKEETG